MWSFLKLNANSLLASSRVRFFKCLLDCKDQVVSSHVFSSYRSM